MVKNCSGGYAWSIGIFLSGGIVKNTLSIETAGGQQKKNRYTYACRSARRRGRRRCSGGAAVRVTGHHRHSPFENFATRRAGPDRPADGVPSCLPLSRRPVIKNWMHSSAAAEATAAATIEATGLLIVIISLSGSARVCGVCAYNCGCVCVCVYVYVYVTTTCCSPPPPLPSSLLLPPPQPQPQYLVVVSDPCTLRALVVHALTRRRRIIIYNTIIIIIIISQTDNSRKL